MKRGYTYLELIVTVAILGIILSIALIKFDSIDERMEEREVKQLVSTLKEARTYSLKKRKTVLVEFKEDGIKVSDMNGIISEYDLKRLKLENNFKDSKIEFKMSSFAARAGTIDLVGKKTYRITIPVATGKITYKGVVK